LSLVLCPVLGNLVVDGERGCSVDEGQPHTVRARVDLNGSIGLDSKSSHFGGGDFSCDHHRFFQLLRVEHHATPWRDQLNSD
jgi:hypothetical protein